jgi:UPF0755 protein
VSAAAALDGSVEANDEQKAIPTGVGSTAAVVTATDSKDPMHARAFDSSRGTPSDPLKNKTYDLNYAKTVPQMQ